jgi:hypothetical protein
MIHGGVEGFNGRVDGRLDTDEDSHSQGDSYHGKKGSSFMVTEMAKGDVFEEVKEDHGATKNSKHEYLNPKFFRV